MIYCKNKKQLGIEIFRNIKTIANNINKNT